MAVTWILCEIIGGVAPGAAATPPNDQWADNFGIAGVNGDVRALARDAKGNVYVGGMFTHAGGAVANYIAMWDGKTWHTLGAGVNGWVFDLAMGADGKLYAACGSSIAIWDGASWSYVHGFNNWIFALALDGNVIYAGGWSGNYGCIAKWDGSSWSTLQGGLDNGHEGGPTVYALAVDSNGNLYAGGDFHTAYNQESVTVNHIAKWDGSAWSALGTGMDGGYVHALVVDGGDLYAGGSFLTAGGVDANYLARWNGAASTWSEVGGGLNAYDSGYGSQVRSLRVDGDGNLYAGGSFEVGGATCIAVYDASTSTWSALGSGTTELVYSLLVDGSGNLYAGGMFLTAGGVIVHYVATWNGGKWSLMGSGTGLTNFGAENGTQFLYPPAAMVGDGRGRLYAGGYFNEAIGIQLKHVGMWDGATWHALGSGLHGYVHALAVDASGNLYAGGELGYVAKWDGSSWSPLGGGINGVVHALAFDASGNLYAGGRFNLAGGVAVNSLAKWDGSKWSDVGGGLTKDTIYEHLPVAALCIAGNGDLYVGGDFDKAGDNPANRIAKWNGSSWSALGSGMSDQVNSLAVDDAGNLYAGGRFLEAGGVTVNYIAKWDGTTWHDLEGGTGQEVYALALRSGILYVGGIFCYAGGVYVGVGIARWNGSTWSALGDGMNYWVYSLAFDRRGNLYAGGPFTTAGGKPSINIAKWQGSADGAKSLPWLPLLLQN